MGWKCAPQVLGLVREEPKPGQKHRANGYKIAKEAGFERASKSQTLDRSRSNLNEYMSYTNGKGTTVEKLSGAKFWDAIETEASEYRVKVPGKTKTGDPIIREKGLQHNAIVGWAVIYNPPADVCRDWSQEEYSKFFNDCRECMAEISPVFAKENLRFSAFHLDEGVPPEKEGDPPDGHVHDIGVPKDENGRYIGSQIGPKLLVSINERFPSMMRQRGWNMDDLDTTDFERAKIDADYKAERDMKRGDFGLSVNRHLFKKANQMIDDVTEIEEALRQRELAIDNREQAQEELILLGRRSKALLDDEDDELTPRKERRLPNIDF